MGVVAVGVAVSVLPVTDARWLRLIRHFPVRPRGRAHSIEQHRIGGQNCLCHTLHGHCYAVRCPCPRHAGETG